MGDVIDKAQDHIEREAEQRERAIRERAALPPVDDCEECGEPIEAARRRLELRHCLPCAQGIEARRMAGRRW